jgi:glycosyltransferase involved in cell wall biosynthesis
MPRPLVSVVIPFFNPPVDFLREAIASVAAQDYRPVELILVNDGSCEPVVTFARGILSSTDIDSRWVEHDGGENRGSSASRNLGVSVASGEYVAFLDADDTWAPNKLSEQTACLRHKPEIGMVFGQTRYWYSWVQNAASGDFIVSRGVERAVTFEPPEFVAQFLRGGVIVPSASNTMMRRAAYLSCGGFEESFRDMYEDQAFLVKLGLRYTIAGVPICWDSYRQHAQSMTASANRLGTEQQARRRFLDWVKGYCRQEGVQAPQVWEAVNKEWWLSKPGSGVFYTRRERFAGKMKRWVLRVEEWMLPAGFRHRLWGQYGLLSDQSHSDEKER